MSICNLGPDQKVIPIYLATRTVKGLVPELAQNVKSESTILSFAPVPDDTETSEDNLRLTTTRAGESPFLRILVWRGEIFESEGRWWLRTPKYPALDPERALAYARERRLGFVVPGPEHQIEESPGPGPEPPTVPEDVPGSEPEWDLTDGGPPSVGRQYMTCNRCLAVRGIESGHPCPRCSCPEYTLVYYQDDGYFYVGRIPELVEDDAPKPKKPKPSRPRKAAPEPEKPAVPEKKPAGRKPVPSRDLPGQGMLFD